LKGNAEKQPAKKIVIISSESISKFFYVKDSFEREDVPHKEFLDDLSLLIVKNNLPIQLVESMRLKHLILHLCPKLNFPSRRQFLQERLLGLVEKTSQQYVCPSLVNCFSATHLIFGCLREFMMFLH
jgi:hypothetical protein